MPSNIATSANQRPLADNDIRVLILHAGPSESPIRVSLEHVSAESRSEAKYTYDALSYEWGTPNSPKKTIYLNGSPIQIRENLFLALQHIRVDNKDQRLWIDALCINQDDILERNHQVQLMGSIYLQARAVIAWLGPENENSAAGFQCVRDWAGRAAQPFRPDKRSYGALCKLHFRSYWSRLWIVQEFSLAQELIIACGKEKVNWVNFDVVSLTPPHEDVLLPVFSDMVRSPCRNVRSIRISREEPTLSTSLLLLLQKTHEAVCQDVRDRVYGLLGLFDMQTDSLPPVDYSKDVFEVFEDIVKHFVHHTSDERLKQWKRLHLIEMSRETQNALGIGTATYPFPRSRNSKTTTNPINFEAHGLVRMDVAKIGPRIGTLSAVCALNKWKSRMKGYIRLHNGHGNIEIRDYMRNARVQPLKVSDRDVSRVRTINDVFDDAYTGTCDISISPIISNKTPQRMKPEHDKSCVQVTFGTSKRNRRPRLAKSRRGEIALVPWNTKVGDIICQFDGTDACAILSGRNKPALKGTAVVLRSPDALLRNEEEVMETTKFSSARPLYKLKEDRAMGEAIGEVMDGPSHKIEEVSFNMDIRTLQFLTV